MEKIKVCIIGAGIGGLTAGALLTKEGYSVTIFEKESQVGGRALTLDMSKISLKDVIVSLITLLSFTAIILFVYWIHPS